MNGHAHQAADQKGAGPAGGGGDSSSNQQSSELETTSFCSSEEDSGGRSDPNSFGPVPSPPADQQNLEPGWGGYPGWH